MSQLPVYKTDDQSHQMMQNKWKSQLDPILANPLLAGLAIKNVNISSGHAAIVNHLLGRQMQGWIITDQNAPAKIARIQAFNTTTLTLSADATTTLNLWVY